MPSQSSLANIYYKRRIVTTDGTDITGDAVSFAFMPRAASAAPSSGDWHTASYITTNVWGVVVGPSGVVLTAGTYNVWQKITDSPEVLVELVDVLEVTA